VVPGSQPCGAVRARGAFLFLEIANWVQLEAMVAGWFVSWNSRHIAASNPLMATIAVTFVIAALSALAITTALIGYLLSEAA
jgi:hypothetical protein